MYLSFPFPIWTVIPTVAQTKQNETTMVEEQAPEATAMSTTPTPESGSAAEEDDDFGTFSAYDTAESNDIKSDDGPQAEMIEENVPATAPPPPAAMMSSSLNEDEFYDASSDAAGMNQINDLSDENTEEGAAAEQNQPEVDLFGSVDHDAAITPDTPFAAVQSEGVINDNNIVADATDPFSAFDGISDNDEGGGEQNNEASDINEQDSNIATDGFGEFEGTGNDSSNNIDDSSLSNDKEEEEDDAVEDSPVDTSEPVAVELATDESTNPESGENPPPETYFTEETHTTVSLKGGASAFDGHASSEMNEITESEPKTSASPNDTSSSAFDAFAEIQDAPLPSSLGSATSSVKEAEGDTSTFGESEPVDVVIESTTNFGKFAEVTSLKNVADEKLNNEDKFTFTSSLDDNTAEEVDREDAEETETTTEVVSAQMPEISVNEAPTPVETSAEDEDSTLTAAKGDNGDVFGAYETTVPIHAPQESTYEIETTKHESAECLDDGETLPTPMDATGFPTPCEEGREEKQTNKDSPDAQDSFGFSSFEASVEGTTANEIEKDEVIFVEDAAPVESAVEETDAFVAFSAPTEEDIDTADADQDFPAEEDTALATEKNKAFDEKDVALDAFVAFSAPTEEDIDTADADQDFPAEEDTALATEKNKAFDEKDVAFDDIAIEDSDTAPAQEVLPDEADTALAEEDKVPVQTTVEESDGFGDFIAPTETDTARIDVDTLAEGAIEESDFDEFGEFAAVSVVEDDALAEGDLPVKVAIGLTEQDAPFPEKGTADDDDFGNFSAPVGEAPLTEVDSALTENDDAPVETAVEENDDFGDFTAPVEVETALDTALVAPDEVESTSPVEAAVNESDEFGDFGGFSSPSIEDGATIEAAATEGADEDFGDFGDFSAPVETEIEGPGESHKPVDAQPTVEDDEGDDFGEFGDFAAFEEAAPSQQTQDEEKATEDDITTPQVQSSHTISAEEDEFGDFGDFEESDAVEDTSGKSEPSGPVLVLNANVRDMFQKVFQVDKPVNSENGDDCIRLPFDVPMRTVLVSKQ